MDYRTRKNWDRPEDETYTNSDSRFTVRRAYDRVYGGDC